MRRYAPLLAGLCATLLLAPAAVAVAQDVSPSPVPESPAPEMMSPAPEANGADDLPPQALELLALFPTQIAGQPVVEEPLVVVGQELIADLDPGNEADARQLAAVEVVLETADATIEEVTSASVLVDLGGGAIALVGAFRIEGSDALATLSAYVDAYSLDVAEPVTEAAEIGGREVVLVNDSANPESGPAIFLASGDVTWIVVAPEAIREEVIESLP